MKADMNLVTEVQLFPIGTISLLVYRYIKDGNNYKWIEILGKMEHPEIPHLLDDQGGTMKEQNKKSPKNGKECYQ